MLYNTPAKCDDGIYIVKALNDEKRKCFVQLNQVKVADVSGDISFELTSDRNREKIQHIDTLNLEAARENSATWFGKELSEEVIQNAYTPSIVNDQITGDRIPVTKVFNADQEMIDFEMIKQNKKCNIILEFAGLWFAKKAFGPAWNIVQVRVFDDPVIDTYPEDYAFADDDEE